MYKYDVIVDQENYLHSEEDPRYRGAAIPSKAFKMLQNMTDGCASSTTIPNNSSTQQGTNKK